MLRGWPSSVARLRTEKKEQSPSSYKLPFSFVLGDATWLRGELRAIFNAYLTPKWRLADNSLAEKIPFFSFFLSSLGGNPDALFRLATSFRPT